MNINRIIGTLTGLFLAFTLSAQTNFRSNGTGGGAWNTTATWQVESPNGSNNWIAAIGTPSSVSNTIQIRTGDLVTVSAAVTIDQTTIDGGGSVSVASATLTLVNVANALTVNGTLTLTGTGVITSPAAADLIFTNGSTYTHARNAGTIPTATWNTNSLCNVTGITANVLTGLTPAGGFHNFTWNNTGQTGTINLGGNLKTVKGDLIIQSTNNQSLQFATSTVYTLSITGNFNVSGSSRIAFCTTAAGVAVNLTGNFNFSSTSPSTSNLKSSGSYAFNIGGNYSQSAGVISAGTAANAGTINLVGNFTQSGGTLTQSGAGSGLVVFNGASGIQHVSCSGTLSNVVGFSISNALGIILDSNLTLPSALTQSAGAGNINLNGKVLTVNGNFTQTSGALAADATSEFILQGTGTLSGTVNFSGTNIQKLEVNQTGTISTASTLTVTNLNLLNGALNTATLNMASGGQIIRLAGTITNTPGGSSYNVLYTNTGAINTGPELPASATVLNNLSKQGAGTTTLSQSLVTINGNLTTSAGIFASGANSISLAGNFVCNSALTAAAGAIFTFTGAAPALSGNVPPSFRDLNIQGALSTSVGFTVAGILTVSGILTPGANYQINGNYVVGAGATVNAGTGVVSFGGTTTVSNGGTINLNSVTINAGSSLTAPSNTMGIAGNLATTNAASIFAHNGGTIVFNGTTVLSGSAAKTFNNVVVTGSLSAAGAVGWGINGTLTNNGTINFSASSGSTTFGGATCTLSGSGSTSFGPLVISANNLLTTTADFSLTTLNIGNGATLNANSNFSMTGNFTGTGSFACSGTATFAGGTSSMTGAGSKNFKNITINNGATFSPTVSYTIIGDITVNGTGVLADPNNTHTIIFDGATTISGTSTAITFDAVTINASRSVNASTDITIDNAFNGTGNFSSSSKVTFTGLTITGNGSKSFNNVTVGAGTLTPNASWSISGNLIVTGTLGAGNATTTFNGTTTTSGAGSVTFNNLVVSNALTSSSGIITINGLFTNNGTFNGNSGTLNLVGNFINNGTFNHGGGTVSFSTTANARQDILGTQSTTFNNLQVNDVVAGALTDVSNELGPSHSVNIAGTLSFGEINSRFDADGSANNSGFVVLSTADNPARDGRIGTLLAGCDVSGTINVQRFVSSENRIYRYIASPVVGATVAMLKSTVPVTGVFSDPSNGSSTPPCTGCIATSPSLYFYDEAAAAYVAFPGSGVSSGAATFINGRGYSAFFRHSGVGAVGTVTLNFTGTNPPQAGVTLPISPILQGYSLVGNPYPSEIVWNNGAGWTKNQINDVIVVRDNATGGHKFFSAAAGDGVIAAGQSFWVQRGLGGASLQINENAKIIDNVHNFFRMKESSIDQLELLLTKETTGVTDNARIVIVEGSSSLYDAFDAYKFNNVIDNGSSVTEVQDISVLTNEATPKALAVNSVPAIVCNQSYNIKVTNFINTGETIVNYSLALNPSGAMSGMVWTLHDNYTGNDINLSSRSSYSFQVDNSIAASKSPSRFTIKGSPSEAIDISNSITASAFVCSGKEAKITIVSQNGMTYGVEINGTYYRNIEQGNGGKLSIFIEDDKLTAGLNVIRVKANSGCDQQFLNAVVNINKEIPNTISGVTGGARCKSGAVNLSASSAQSDATLHWYEGMNSSNIIGNGPNFVTPVLSDTTIFYVAAASTNGCEGDRVPVTAAVTNLTSKIIVSPPSLVCKGKSIVLYANTALEDVSFNWYESETSSTPLSSDSEWTTPALQQSAKYFVAYTNSSGCESERVEAEANVFDFVPDLKAESIYKAVCPGGNHQLVAKGAPSGSVYQWFETKNSIYPLKEGDQFTTPELNGSTSYFLSATNEMGCPSARIAVNASVDISDPAPSFSYSYNKICRNDASLVVISGSAPDINYRWYETPAGEGFIKEGFQLITNVIEEDKHFYISAVNANGCEGKIRKEIVIGVTKFEEAKIDTTEKSILKSNFTTGNQWYLDTELLAGETGQNLIAKKPGYYNLKVSVNGCEQWAAPMFRGDLITSIEDYSRTFNIYPNPATEIVNMSVYSSSEVEAQLMDEQGKPVTSMVLNYIDGSWIGQMDVRSISRGWYFLRLKSKEKSITHKLIIH